LLSPDKLFCGFSSRGHCASSVLRADPPPIEASRSLGIPALLPPHRTCETSMGFPSCVMHPSPEHARSPTPADSPTPSPRVYWCLPRPGESVVGVTSRFLLRGLQSLPRVGACRSLCLRFAMLVTSHSADSIPAGWLGPLAVRISPLWIMRLQMRMRPPNRVDRA